MLNVLGIVAESTVLNEELHKPSPNPDTIKGDEAIILADAIAAIKNLAVTLRVLEVIGESTLLVAAEPEVGLILLGLALASYAYHKEPTPVPPTIIVANAKNAVIEGTTDTCILEGGAFNSTAIGGVEGSTFEVVIPKTGSNGTTMTIQGIPGNIVVLNEATGTNIQLTGGLAAEGQSNTWVGKDGTTYQFTPIGGKNHRNRADSTAQKSPFWQQRRGAPA